jgi:hypothetical protein
MKIASGTARAPGAASTFAPRPQNQRTARAQFLAQKRYTFPRGGIQLVRMAIEPKRTVRTSVALQHQTE